MSPKVNSKSKTRVKRTALKSRKIFVIDTSVLLYDRNALTSFPGGDVVIPIIVLDELDHFKDKPGLIGENSRFVNRFLDSFREDNEHLHEGVYLDDIDQNIKVEIDIPIVVPGGLENTPDNKIIGLAYKLKEKYAERSIVVVTKDINFRVKCDALGIMAEDYYKDNVPKDNIPGGVREIFVIDDLIDKMYAEKEVSIDDFKDDDDEFSCWPCEPLVLKGTSRKEKSALVIESNKKLKLVNDKRATMNMLVKINPKNKEQAFALHMLTDSNMQLVTLTGIAGSGKTFLSLMAGLSGLYDKKYKRIVITRPIQPVGRDLGYLPGDVDEKMAVWLRPIIDNFREGAGDENFFDMMKTKGEIEVAPLSYIRGRTFNESFIIVDEAQNATIHELKTVITRVGKGSKIVLLGDIDQVDTPYIDTFSNGLTITVDKFKDQKIAGHVSLPKSERSELADIASKIL